MKIESIVLSFVTATAFALSCPIESPAGCNMIPDPAQLSSSGQVSEAIKATIPMGLPYRGVLGRIDRAVAVPGVTQEVVLGPDPTCGSTGIVDADGSGMIDRDDVAVALLFQPAGAEGTLAHILASKAFCQRIARLSVGRRGLIQLGECGSDHVTLLLPMGLGGDQTATEYRLHVPYPRTEVLAALRGKSPSVLAGPAIAVVVPATERGIATLSEVAVNGCAPLAERRDAAYVCVDRIYNDFAERCGVGPGTLTTVPCNFQNTAPEVDYAEQCDSDPPTGSDLAACDKKPTKLAFSVDECGGVHIPFAWSRIRTTTGGTTITRIVGGTSAVGSETQATGPRIFIPGREFIGSTHPNDPQGVSGDWRKPEISVWYTADHPEEFGLIGTTDKDRSIVHVYPRLEVTQLCDSFVAENEACLAIEQMTNGGVEKCAEQDRSGANPLCKSLLVGRFFACEGGSFEGMPCTRPMHCGIGGTCTGQPNCQKAGEVWQEGKKLEKSGTCWRDADCARGQKTQCGYKLFDFGDRLATDNLVTLEASVTSGSGKKNQRGVCSNKRSDTCDNSSAPKPCPSGAGPCRGYILNAKGQK